jgi:hypothetical protein
MQPQPVPSALELHQVWLSSAEDVERLDQSGHIAAKRFTIEGSSFALSDQHHQRETRREASRPNGYLGKDLEHRASDDAELPHGELEHRQPLGKEPVRLQTRTDDLEVLLRIEAPGTGLVGEEDVGNDEIEGPLGSEKKVPAVLGENRDSLILEETIQVRPEVPPGGCYHFGMELGHHYRLHRQGQRTARRDSGTHPEIEDAPRIRMKAEGDPGLKAKIRGRVAGSQKVGVVQLQAQVVSPANDRYGSVTSLDQLDQLLAPSLSR